VACNIVLTNCGGPPLKTKTRNSSCLRSCVRLHAYLKLFINYRLMHALFHIRTVIIPRNRYPVLVMEEAGVPGENHRPWTSNW